MRRCVAVCVFGLLIVGPALVVGGPAKGTHPPMSRPPAHWRPRHIAPSSRPFYFHHPHYHHACPIWPIVAGSIIGSAVVEAIYPAPPVSTMVVVQSPAVQPVQVWVDSYWKEERDAYGKVISYAWIPGHWEYR